MNRIKRIAAAATAVAALAAVTAAPASAQEIYISPPPCDNVPGCVNYALDVGEAVVAEVERIYREEVQPTVNDTACTAYYVITGVKCED